ncbi:MAG: glycosyltransferase [Gemmatimonadales bacterium]
MMDSSPRVSILIPCRNAENTLDAAFYSLIGQTFTDFEVIAVDDGSTDATGPVLDTWADRDPRIHVTHSDCEGIVGALQNAATRASGELMARMDADDVAHPERLAKQVAYLDRHRELVGCGTQVRYFPTEAVRDGARRYEGWINSLVTPEDIERDLFVECPIPHPTLMMRRDVFEAVGGYHDGEWPEDYDLVLRCWSAGHRFGKVAEVLLDWREAPERASRTDAQYSEDAFRRCKVAYLGKRIGERSVVVCGSGPVGKAFARELVRVGHELVAFADVDPRKVGQEIYGVPVVSPEGLDEYRACYLLGAVGSDEGRSNVRADLEARGFRELIDYCAVA